MRADNKSITMTPWTLKEPEKGSVQANTSLLVYFWFFVGLGQFFIQFVFESGAIEGSNK